MNRMNRRSFLTLNAISAAGFYIQGEVFGILPPHQRLQRAIVSPSVATSGAFDPTAPGSVWGYWKAGTGITQSANAVSAWADQSGNNHHLTQATGANQPTYATAQLNGFPSITFDGTNDFLTSGGYDATFAQPFSLVAVCKPITWIDNCQILSGQGGSGIWQYSATPILMEYAGGGLAVQVSPTINTWIVLIAVFNGTSSFLQVGTSAPVAGANTSHTSPMQDMEMGSKYDGTHTSNVAFVEAISFKKALSSGEANTIGAGYKSKFVI